MTADSPIRQLPPPPVIHERIGQLYRELALLRRLLRLSQAANGSSREERRQSREAVHVG
jgi:hypothetical protein